MSQEDKEKMLRKIYYSEDGFGSINETYKEAKKQLNTITLEDTKTWLEKQKGRQTKAYEGFNSYVADEPLEEIQIDLVDFTRNASENDGYRYCLVAVDVFTKMLWGVPIKNNKPKECIRAFNDVLDKIGIPKQIYHDNEGSLSSIEFIRLVNSHKIKHLQSPKPGHTTGGSGRRTARRRGQARPGRQGRRRSGSPGRHLSLASTRAPRTPVLYVSSEARTL